MSITNKSNFRIFRAKNWAYIEFLDNINYSNVSSILLVIALLKTKTSKPSSEEKIDNNIN